LVWSAQCYPLVIKEKIPHEQRLILTSPTKKERREYNRLISAEVGAFFNACLEEDPSRKTSIASRPTY